MFEMLRLGVVTVVGTLALLLAGAAGAAEIARPITYKVPFSGKPGGPAEGRIKAETRGGRLAGYLILEEKRVRGEDWVGVRLGTERPNDRLGWVEEERVTRVEARYKVHVSLRSRTIALFRGEKRIWRTRVVIGARETPTPRGVFAIHDFYRVNNELRPWQIDLTAHSEVHRTFQGGPGRVAIHGRHGSLRVPWGIRASNGCVRSPDWVLRSLRRLAPVGTPVVVR
jgi:hypothetical protein